MPEYQYKCKDCGADFTAVQKMTEDPLETCQECGGPNVFRVPQLTFVKFKGSGFHINDYPRK